MQLTKKLTFLALALLSGNTLAGGSYNANQAVVYAQKWAEGRNPAYRDFGTNDCTNFFSQSLRAGGLTDDKKAYNAVKNIFGKVIRYDLIPSDTLNWYHINSLGFLNGSPSANTFSHSWTSAEYQARRLSKGYDGWKLSGVYNLRDLSNTFMIEYGDAIFAQWNPQTNPNINHAMLVTGFRKVGRQYEPRLTYHSNNRKNFLFSDFRKNTLSSDPNTKIYIYRRYLRSSIPPTWQVF